MKRFLKGRRLILLGVLVVTLAYMGVARAATTANSAYYYPYPQVQVVQQVVPALSVTTPDTSQVQPDTQVQPDPNAANQVPQYNYQYPGPWMMYEPGPYYWGSPNQNYDPNTNAQPYSQMYPGGWGNRWGWGCW